MHIKLLFISCFLVFFGLIEANASLETPQRTITETSHLEKNKSKKTFSFFKKIKKASQKTPFTKKENTLYGIILLVLAPVFFGYGAGAIFVSYFIQHPGWLIFLGIFLIACSIYFLVKGIKMLKAARRLKRQEKT